MDVRHKLIRLPGKDTVKTTFSPLAGHWESFSFTFCQEKDNMNYALRTLIDGYATAVVPDRQEITVSSIMGCPFVYPLRFINQYAEIWWLPQHQPYSQQLQVRMRRLMQWFIDEATVALEKINSTSLGHNSTSDSQVLKMALTTSADYLDDFGRRLNFWQRLFFFQKASLALHESYDVVKHIYAYLLALQELVDRNHIYLRRLRSQVDTFRRYLSEEASVQFPPKSFMASQKILQENPGLPNIDIWILTFRAYLSKRCKDRSSGKTLPREYYIFCVIYTLETTLSEIDGDALSGVQRVWVMEREEAINRYHLRTKTNAKRVSDSGLRLWRLNVTDTPL